MKPSVRRSAIKPAIGALAALTVAGCEMLPAEVLDGPRILAISANPPSLGPGDTALTLEALTFAVSGDLRWFACPVAWAPSDPLTCPTGNATELGSGNPLTTTLSLGPGATSLWVRVEGGEALPAVRLLKAESGITNPTTTGIAAPDGTSLPSSVAVKTTLELAPILGVETDPAAVITSWYVTAGTLEPARTTGTAPATLTMPDTAPAAPVTIIAVIRNTSGGTTWAAAAVEVTP